MDKKCIQVCTWTHIPDSGGLLKHHHHILSKPDSECTHSESGMVAYQGGVRTVSVGIVIILVCVTNVTSNINLNNAPQEHKLDSLNSKAKGATNETPTCKVPGHTRNGPWTHGCCFEVMYLYVGSGFWNWNDHYYN